MLENSYDALGIRFGIIISPTLRKESKKIKNNIINSEQLINMLSPENTRIIDFDNIDGLTIGQVYDASKENQAEKTIVFATYHRLDLGNGQGTTTIQSLMLISVKEELCDKPIDEAIEYDYITRYPNASEKEKKQIRCFLQRYRYGTKEKTDEKLKEYKK